MPLDKFLSPSWEGLPLPRNFWVHLAWTELTIFDREMMAHPKIQEDWGYSPELAAPYDQVIKESIEMRHITRAQAFHIKKVLGGYFWIATGKAPNYVVDDVFMQFKEQLEELKLYESRAKELWTLFSMPFPTRVDKVIAIDSAIGRMHAGELDFWGIEGSYIGHIIPRILDMLAIYRK